MSTILFIGVLIALTYALSKPAKKKPSQTNRFRSSSQKGPYVSENLIDKGSMLRCHNCGVFFPEERAVRSQVQDLELHFCSQNCKANFRVH